MAACVGEREREGEREEEGEREREGEGEREGEREGVIIMTFQTLSLSQVYQHCEILVHNVNCMSQETQAPHAVQQYIPSMCIHHIHQCNVHVYQCMCEILLFRHTLL